MTEDLARVERTSGWVADLPDDPLIPVTEVKTVKLETHSRKTWTRSEQKIEVSQSEESRLLLTPSASPSRLQSFPSDAWKRSPRTKYTYIDSATYRKEWTPEREITMPHMARRPLDEYDDGEVSFTVPLLYLEKRNSLLLITTTILCMVQKNCINFAQGLFETMHLILPLLVPSHIANLQSVAESDHYFDDFSDDEEEVTYIKRSTYYLHDIYNWTGAAKNNNNGDLAKDAAVADVLTNRIVGNVLNIFLEATRATSRLLSRSTKFALSGPKTLILLLVPSLLTNSIGSAEPVNGISSFANVNGATHQPPNVIIEEVSHIRKITAHFHESWTKASFVQNYLPDVRYAFKSFAALISGLVFSIVLWIDPRTWLQKLPKISRRRIRRWRRRRNYGPPTRFSARIRKLPVQFVGELPVVKRKRRARPPKSDLIIPVEPQETRIERIMADFEKRIEDFKPSFTLRALSRVAGKMGFFKEEEVEMELRRSARLRGERPEYAGLADVHRRRSKVSKELTVGDDLKELMKPHKRTLIASLFAYFGYYDQVEIERRRSLRLQGLDPEFEGLTWGKRRRKTNRRVLPFIFGDYHDDDEVFFEYHDDEEGIFQRWLDTFLHMIGYLKFEDIHDDLEEELESDEEEECHGYVEIPSESFIKRQNQHEAFENSYNFAATQGGVWSDEEDYEGDESTIKITRTNDSCLGLILVLSIPLLLLLSLAIADINVADWSANVVKSLQSGLTQSLYSVVNGTFVVVLRSSNFLWAAVVNAFVLTKSAGTPDIIKIDSYDTLVKDILSNHQFQQLVKEHVKPSEDIKDVDIESNFRQILKSLELKEGDMKQKIDALEAENEQKLEQQHANLLEIQSKINDLKKSIKNGENTNIDLDPLKARLLVVEQELEQLQILLIKCCKDQSVLPFTHDDVKTYLQTRNFATKQDLQAEIDKIVHRLEFDLAELSTRDLNMAMDSKLQRENITTVTTDEMGQMSRSEIEDMVNAALLKYGADKTGAFDFALETAGGSVVSTRCTQMYTDRLPTFTWFGVPLWLPLPGLWGPTTNPRTAIQPGIMPGECWAFKGSMGFLVIKLAMPMKPSRFSLEHIPKSLSPNGRIDSAPKDFVVLGLRGDKDPNPQELGQFTYDQDGEPLQYFSIMDPNSDQIFSHIELKILNNHGNEDYTCLYRFRVHGSP